MKKNIIFGLSFLLCVVLHAQESGNYLHFNVGGGLQNLSYPIQNGTQKGQAGYTLNAAYSYFFSPHWGLQTGIGLQSFNSISTLNNLTTAADIDADGDAYEYRTNYKNWQEKQQALFIDIPLALQYRYTINKKVGLLASVGAKISLPASASFKSVGGEIQTSGYYSEWNVELTDLPDQDFSTYTQKYSGNLTLKPSISGIVDLGGLYKLSEKMDLYVGGYLNYGLNSIANGGTKLVYQKDGVYNGMFASNQITNVKPIAFGLKVGLYFQLAKKKPAISIVEDKEPTIPTINAKPESPKDTIEIIDKKSIVIEKQEDKVKTPVITEKQKEAPRVIPKITKPIDSFKSMQDIASSIRIRFNTNSCQQVSKGENEKLKTLVKYLKANRRAYLQIIGHTCNTGSRHNNMKIGTQRAIEIQQKLIKLGAARVQLIALSKAYDEPLVPNTTEANRAKNRRVELTLLKK